MGLPYELFFFGVFFFGSMVIVNLFLAYRRKEKTYYLAATVGFLVLFAFVLAFLDLLILTLIVVVVTGILSTVWLPKMLGTQQRELIKQRQNVDLSAPLKLRDFLTNKGWLKLASVWGLWKTMFLFYLLSVIVVGGMLLTLSIFVSFVSMEYVVGYTATVPIIIVVLFHQQLKKALTTSEKAKPGS